MVSSNLTNRICFLSLQDTFHHHWREGNLSSAARCEVCRRSCGSSDVLAGMRCEWCGITVRIDPSVFVLFLQEILIQEWAEKNTIAVF